MWIELDERIDALKLHDLALAEKITIAPGAIFSPSGKYRNLVRINCEHAWSARIERAVETLGRIVRTMM